jgi:hypothetical protein
MEDPIADGRPAPISLVMIMRDTLGRRQPARTMSKAITEHTEWNTANWDEPA